MVADHVILLHRLCIVVPRELPIFCSIFAMLVMGKCVVGLDDPWISFVRVKHIHSIIHVVVLKF